MHSYTFRWKQLIVTLVSSLVLFGIGLTAASKASANATANSTYNVPSYHWSGVGNALNTGWTYSWVIQFLGYNGYVNDSHKKENFVPGTYFFTPSYTNTQTAEFPFRGGRPYCTYLGIHHGTTVQSPLTASDTNCENQALAASLKPLPSIP